MRPETAAALYDMSVAAARIAEATTGKSFEEYQADWFFQSAIERQFEILGEALVRVRDLERGVFDSIPDAAKIVGLRNIIIHGYDAIDAKVLWSVVQDRLDDLLKLLNSLLAEATNQGL